MKTLSNCLVVFCFLFFLFEGNAQTPGFYQPLNPLVNSGTDVMIYNNPLVNQTKHRSNAALNNRILVPFICKDSTQNDWLRCFESTNLGVTWNNVYSESRMNPLVFLDATVTNQPMTGGIPSDTLYHFTMYSVYSPSTDAVFLYVNKYLFSNSGYSSTQPFTYYVDYNQNWISNLNISSSLFSVGTQNKDGVIGFSYVLETRNHSGDSLFFHASADNGDQFGTRKLIAACPGGKMIRSASLTYTSQSITTGNPGTFFASWVITDTVTGKGALYVARTTNGPNSSWSAPVRLDILAGAEGVVRETTLSVQENGTNDANEVSCVVLFEKWMPGDDIDILGVYNKTPLSSDTWFPFTIAATPMREVEPNIITSTFPSNTFYITYHDETSNKLKAYAQPANLPDPTGGWICISQGYNDNDNLVLPEPRIYYNQNGGFPGFVWTANIASPDLTLAIFSDNDPAVGMAEKASDIPLTVFPNPASGVAYLKFTSPGDLPANITIYDCRGNAEFMKPIMVAKGINNIPLDLENFTPGFYIIKVTSGTFTSNCRLMVID
jgi:hypothetical protein